MVKKTYNVDEQVVEIELYEKQIDELINRLKELKESKKHIHFTCQDTLANAQGFSPEISVLSMLKNPEHAPEFIPGFLTLDNNHELLVHHEKDLK